MDEVEEYDFAKEFSKNPGLRFRNLSDFSGEEFREDVLEDFFQKNIKIKINVDGVESSLGASFLSEAFGNIAVKYGLEKFNDVVQFDRSSPKGKITYEEMMARVEEALERHGK